MYMYIVLQYSQKPHSKKNHVGLFKVTELKYVNYVEVKTKQKIFCQHRLLFGFVLTYEHS